MRKKLFELGANVKVILLSRSSRRMILNICNIANTRIDGVFGRLRRVQPGALSFIHMYHRCIHIQRILVPDNPYWE